LSPEELIDELAERDYQVVGITDHGFTRTVRSVGDFMLSKYAKHLRELQQKEKRLELKVGLEVDLSIDDGINPEDLPFDFLNQLDYVLFEAGGLERNSLYRGVKPIAGIINKLSVPAGLAHYDINDIYLDPKSLEEVIKLLSENNIFFEINTGHGIPYLSNHSIQLLKMFEISFVIGTDLHGRRRLDENVDEAHRFITDNGFKPHYFVA